MTSPSIDNLYALSALLGVTMDSIIIGEKRVSDNQGPQDDSCGLALSKGWCILAKSPYQELQTQGKRANALDRSAIH